jgi:hypothetical protein
MEYNKIISVTGLGGLFQLVGSKADGAIVRSLEDGSTKFISSRSHQFSHLESIEVYTTGNNVNLVKILNVIKSANIPLPDYKDATAVKKYFEQVYPDMDFDRVYTSDMKKMIRWYSILDKNNVDFNLAASTEAEAPEAEPAQVAAEEPVAEKTKKKAAPKKKKAEE